MILVNDETKLIKQKSSLHLGHIHFASLVHFQASATTDGLEDKLVIAQIWVVASCNHALGTLNEVCSVDLLLLATLTALASTNQLCICVPVYRQRAQRGQLVRRGRCTLDEGRLPVLVSADSTEVCEGNTKGEWVSGVGDRVFVSDVDVLDGDLDVIDDGGNQARGEALVLLLLFCAHAFCVALLQQLCTVKLLHLDSMRTLVLLFCVIVCIFLGRGK